MPLYSPLNSSLQEIRLLTIRPRHAPKLSSQDRTQNVFASLRASEEIVAKETLRDPTIAQLMEMGFSMKSSLRALDECGEKKELLVYKDWLLDHPEPGHDALSKIPANSVEENTEPSKVVQTATTSNSMQEAFQLLSDSKQPLVKGFETLQKTEDEKIIIDCTMETVSLKSCPLFVALSYTWGHPVRNMTIQVNGETVNITTNLAEALQRLQKDEQFVTVWADAISIDQENDVEKGGQVPLMRLIYEQAASVVVWTGPAADNSDDLMTAINHIGKKALEAGIFKTRGIEYQEIFFGSVDTVLSPNQEAIKIATKRLWEEFGPNFPYWALTQFELRRYWTRVWVIQEISVGQDVTVVCGDKETSFARLAATVLFLSTQATTWAQKLTTEELIVSPIKRRQLQYVSAFIDKDAISQHIGNRRKYHNLETGEIEPGLPFYDLLRKTRLGHNRSPPKATDLRDLVYGIVGMASDAEKLGLVPNYKKELVEVYADATRSLFKLGYMELLAWSKQPDQSSHAPSWPTWVPDFSKPILEPCYDEIHNEVLFSASGKHRNSSRASPLTSSNGPNFVALSCFKVDKVEFLGVTWHGENNPDLASLALYFDSIETVAKMAKGFRSLRPGCVVTANWEEAPWRIPSGDLELHGSRYRGTETMRRDFQELKTLFSELELGKPGGNLKLSRSCDMYRLALQMQHNRRTFVSSMGYIGLVPAHSKEGDVICIVEGAKSPFVFRSRGEFYELVGEAYVYGIMDGEFMESGPPMEIFHVC